MATPHSTSSIDPRPIAEDPGTIFESFFGPGTSSRKLSKKSHPAVHPGEWKTFHLPGGLFDTSTLKERMESLKAMPLPSFLPEVEPDYEMDIAAGKIKEGDVFRDGNNEVYRLAGGQVVHIASAYPESSVGDIRVRLRDKGESSLALGTGILAQIEDNSSVKTYTKLTMETLEKAIASIGVNSEKGIMLLTGESGRKELAGVMKTEALILSEPSFPGGVLPSHIPNSFVASVPEMSDTELRDLIRLYYDEELCYDIPENERQDYRIILAREHINRSKKNEGFYTGHSAKTLNDVAIDDSVGRHAMSALGVTMHNPTLNARSISSYPVGRESSQVEHMGSVIIKSRRSGMSYVAGVDPVNPPTPYPGGSPSGDDRGLGFTDRVKAMMKLVRKGIHK